MLGFWSAWVAVTLDICLPTVIHQVLGGEKKERRLIVTRGFLFEVSLYEDTVFIPLDLLALADEQPANTISFSR